MSVSKPWELYYWPDIQGRGEFIRLALEEAGIDYVDVARSHKDGTSSLVAALEAENIERPPFATEEIRSGIAHWTRGACRTEKPFRPGNTGSADNRAAWNAYWS